MVCGLHKEQIRNGSGNGGAGIDMLPKDHRGLSGKDVTEDPSSHAGDDAQKGAEEAVVSKTGADGHVDSGGSEKPKPHCVQEIQDIVIGLSLEMQELAPFHPDGQKHTVDGPEGDDGVGGIQEHSRRRLADEDIPAHPSAYGGGDAQDHDPQIIQTALYGHHGAGAGKGNGPDDLQDLINIDIGQHDLSFSYTADGSAVMGVFQG